VLDEQQRRQAVSVSININHLAKEEKTLLLACRQITPNDN
jgi:hypothetical protein